MSDIYYHFIRINDAGQPFLGYDDNRIVQVGETITVDGEPELCAYGLHASKRAIDALQYALGRHVAMCKVTLGGIVKHSNDKSTAQERTIVRMLTAEQTDVLLRAFARWCASSVANLWDMPSVVREYLETGNETLRAAARDAAWAAQEAARDAARDAAWAAAARAAAARAAARAAAWQAAADAAGAAARAAAWQAAGAAAWAAAWAAAGAAAGAAAQDAARAAAWDAAGAAQNTKFIAMFEEACNE